MDYLDFDCVFVALGRLCEIAGLSKPTKHMELGDPARPVEMATSEIVDLMDKIIKNGDCPNFVVPSTDLEKVPMVSFSNGDVVPLGARMSDLEKVVTDLAKKIDKFEGVNDLIVKKVNEVKEHNEKQAMSFAAVTKPTNVPSTVMNPPRTPLRARTNSCASMRTNLIPRERLDSTKRKHDETGNDKPEEDYQVVTGRRNARRQINYGKSQVQITGRCCPI